MLEVALMRLPPLLAAVFAAAVLGACGGGSSDGQGDDGNNSAERFKGDQRGGAQVVEDFATAVRGNDWKKICGELFAPYWGEAVTRRSGRGTCEQHVERRYGKLDDLAVDVSAVDVQRLATVEARTAAGDDVQFDLIREADGWHLDRETGRLKNGGQPSRAPAPGGGDEAAAGQVVLDFDRALAEGDWDRVCRLYTGARRDFFDDCPAEARQIHGKGALGLKLTRAAVTTSAAATAGPGEPTTFNARRNGGRWQIDGVNGRLQYP